MKPDQTSEVEEREPRHETPLLRVVTPNTTPEEIAAIVAVLSSMGASATPERKQRSAWASPARKVRTPVSHGRGGWRLSGLPRG